MRYSVRGIRKLPKSTGLPSLMTGPPRNAPHEISAVDDRARTHRRIRRGDADCRVITPDVFLCLLVEQREVPVVHADDRAHPARGSAVRRDAAHRFVERRRIALQATPLLGLQQLEEADLVQFGHRLIREAAQVLGRLRALGDQRQQVVDAGQDRLHVTLFNGRH
jgi:hypothetical protein